MTSHEIASADALLTANAELRGALDVALAENEARIGLERRLVAERDQARTANMVFRRVLEVCRRDASNSYIRHLCTGILRQKDAGAEIRTELEAARAVVAAARTGFGTEEDIRRAWAFDPNLLTARIRAYDAALKGLE